MRVVDVVVGRERETRCNAVMPVTKNMRPSTDSLIMGAAINKPPCAEELGRSLKLSGDAELPTSYKTTEEALVLLYDAKSEFAQRRSIEGRSSNFS